MKFKYLIWLLSLSVFFACSEKPETEDPPESNAPQFSSANISGDNSLVELWFSEPVFKGGLLNQPLSKDDFHFDFKQDGALLDSLHFFHIAGDSLAIIRLFTSGLASGLEELTITPASHSSVVNSKAIPMKADDKITLRLRDIGLVGNWLSTGENLSALFQGFGFDSVFVSFRSDSSYIFRSKTAGGIVNVLTGSYEQRNSSLPGIRHINMEQQHPVVATLEGIFSLENGNPVKMTFETVQTNPAVQGLTPPQPDLGFGSSGMVGADNIQMFIRVL